MEQSDENLIQAFQQGDRTVLTVIFQRYKTRLLNFCIGILGNRADAEEAAAEVFLALFTSRFDVSRGVKFSTWIYTIARNQCVTRIRKRKYWGSLRRSSHNTEDPQVWDVPDTEDLSDEELTKKEIGESVRAAIDKLPLEQKEAIVLRQYHQFSYEEISVILNCSLEKVKILIYRGKERLRVELAFFIKEQRT